VGVSDAWLGLELVNARVDALLVQVPLEVWLVGNGGGSFHQAVFDMMPHIMENLLRCCGSAGGYNQLWTMSWYSLKITPFNNGS
jgi:hypothetical protein